MSFIDCGHAAMRKVTALAFAAAVVSLASPLATACAVVLIDHFDQPSPIPTPNRAFADTFATGQSIATGIAYSNGGGSVLGFGTIGGNRRLFAENPGGGLFAQIGANLTGNTSNLSATLPSGNANSLLTYVVDGTGNTTQVTGKLNLSNNTSIGSEVLSASEISMGLGNIDFISPGYGANGIVLKGLTGALSGGATMSIGIFSTLNDYAFVEFSSFTAGDVFIPFAYPNYVQDGVTNFATASISKTLTQIFQSVNAVVIQFSNNGFAGASGTVGLDAIFANTPEPTTFVVWGFLSLFAAMFRMVRPSRQEQSSADVLGLATGAC